MSEYIKVTKNDIAEIVEAVVNKKVTREAVQRPKVHDITSPNYNTNLLFNDISKKFKANLREIQQEKLMYQQERWGIVYDINVNQAHDSIRKLVLMSFGVVSANRLSIAERGKARDLYLSISNIFLQNLKNNKIQIEQEV